MNLDKRLLALLKTARSPFVFTIVTGTIAGLAVIFKAGILSSVLNSVFLEDKGISDVSNSIFILIAIVAVQFLFFFLREWSAGKTSERIKTGLRNDLIGHINDLGPINSRNKSTGELSSLMVEGVDGIDRYFSQYLPGLFLTAIIPILILFFVFPQDILSGIILLVTAPLIPFFMILIGKSANDLTRKQWDTLSRMSSFFLDIFQGLVTLKIFNKSKQQINQLRAVSEKFRRSTMKVLRVAFLSALMLEIIASISTAIIAAEIGLRLLHGSFDFRSAIFILLLAPEFYLPLRRLGSQFHAGQESLAAAHKLYEVLEQKTASLEGSGRIQSVKPQDIVFRDVTFKYDPDGKDTIDRVNLEMGKGKFTVLAGYSGAGKSTIINLVLKFIDPAAGKITYGGNDLDSISAGEWRQMISLIPQKPYIFHGSIKDNIDIGRNHDIRQVAAAAKSAYIHDFISGLPRGYDTVIGEQGTDLSGGQVQRIAIARAFLKDSPLLILDEPTSNLDPTAEDLIFKAMRKLVKDKTVIGIAHKLKTLQSAETIYVIDNGRVEELGTHAQLQAHRKIYYRRVGTHV